MSLGEIPTGISDLDHPSCMSLRGLTAAIAMNAAIMATEDRMMIATLGFVLRERVGMEW